MAKKIKKKSAKKAVKKATKKVVKKIAKKKASKKPAAKSAKKAVKKVVKKSAKKTVKKAASKKPAAPAPIQRSTSISPYLTFSGNCEEAFNFYKGIFGGKFNYLGRFGEMPPMEGQPPIPDSEKNKIMHVSLPIGNGSVLFGSDSSEAFGHATVIGNNFSISVNATSPQEADKLFNGLSNGGQATMPMNKTFWGSYFGMLTDKYGIQWLISYDANGSM